MHHQRRLTRAQARNAHNIYTREPAPVYQTDFSPGKGNALQACVASILHAPIDSVSTIALFCLLCCPSFEMSAVLPQGPQLYHGAELRRGDRAVRWRAWTRMA